MSKENPLNIAVCEVINVKDKADAGRIQVFYPYEDNFVTEEDKLAWCIPLMPKLFHVKPKVGESVLVLTAKGSDATSQRYYIGPVIPQLTQTKESIGLDAKSIFRGGRKALDEAPNQDATTIGAFPDDDDVAIVGKDATDIILKDNDLRIRCGIRKNRSEDYWERRIGGKRSNVYFNENNAAYIKLKYDENSPYKHKSSINVVADKINLIGNNDAAKYKINVANHDDLISDKDVQELIEKAHTLPYGDELADFLKLFVKTFIAHTHPYWGGPLCPTGDVEKLMGYDYKQMQSDTVHIT